MIGWLRALPIAGKLAVLAAIILAIGLIVAGVNNWIDGIRESGRREVRAEWAAEKAGAAQAKAELEGALSATLAPMFDRLGRRIGAIDATAARINVTLPKEVASDPRYSDPRCTLTPGVREGIDAARRLSETAAPVGGDDDAVPAGR